MKIKTRIFSTIAVFSLIITIVLVGVFHYFYSNFAKREISNYLQSLIDSKTSHVSTVLNSQKEKVKLLTKDTALFARILQMSSKDDEYEELYDKIQARLEQIVQNDFYETSLLNNRGVIIASNNSNRVGEDKSDHVYFSKSREEMFISKVYFCDTSEQYARAFFVPIFDSNKEKIGVLVVEVGMSELDSVVAEASGRETEVYLVNSSGLMVTQSVFAENTALKQKVDTKNVKNCFASENKYVVNVDSNSERKKLFVSFVNYRGVSVIGHYARIPQTDWCLLAEIEEKQAFASLRKTWFISTISLVVMSIIILVVSKLVGSKISQPIEELAKGAEAIEQGNLSRVIVSRSKDEVGMLGITLNKMRVSLKGILDSINRKVEEQTVQIRKKQLAMNDQQRALLNILEDIEKEKEKTTGVVHDLRKFKLAVDNASDHIMITDPKCVILYANKAMEGITGFSIEEAVGKKATSKDLWGGETNDQFCKRFWKTVKKHKETFSAEVANKRKNGEEYDALVEVSPVLDEQSKLIFIVWIERDISKEKEIDRAKSEFVSLASHQLRTPLSAINWYTEMLMAEDAGKINKTQKEYLNEVYKGSKRMVDLVNALLNVSRLELGTFMIDPEIVDIVEIAEDVLKELTPKIKKKELKVTKKYDKKLPKMKLDKKLTVIIFQNLLSNAVKYTSERGKIGLKISKVGEYVKIVISDTGMGIPKKQQDKLFTKLFRADNARESGAEGTGLGMYIIKSILDHSGGKIEFESEEGKGTIFDVRIPLKGMKKKSGSKKLD